MIPHRLAVVGAGVSGLAAAQELVRRSDLAGIASEVMVFEAQSQVGGRVKSESFQGASIDLGAESMLVRSPETMAALGALGLADQVVRPGTTAASIWNGRRLVPMPRSTALGVPPHPLRWEVIRLLGLLGSARVAAEPWLRGSRPGADDPLGPFLAGRIGHTAVRRLVDPLLGGIYAGSTELLSIGAVAPHLLAALDRDHSLLRGLRQPSPASPAVGFISLKGGLQTLPLALARALPPTALRTGTAVRRLSRGAGDSIRVELDGGDSVEVDGVALAVPAPAAAQLIQGISGELARELGRQEYSNVATLTMAYPAAALPQRLPGSGFLVPRGRGRVVTACTFLDQKWPHLREPGLVMLRASAGSVGEEWPLEVDDATLVTSVHTHLRRFLGLRQVPIAVRVQRWQPALPQYRAGHLSWCSRVDGITASLPVRLALCGSSFRGVGLEACLRDGARAGASLWEQVAHAPSGTSSAPVTESDHNA